jgi:hypothetical protein
LTVIKGLGHPAEPDKIHCQKHQQAGCVDNAIFVKRHFPVVLLKEYIVPNYRVFNFVCDLDIVIWNLFVFWCLHYGIWHYFRRAGEPLNHEPKTTRPMFIVMFTSLKYQTAVDNGLDDLRVTKD